MVEEDGDGKVAMLDLKTASIYYQCLWAMGSLCLENEREMASRMDTWAW